MRGDWIVYYRYPHLALECFQDIKTLFAYGNKYTIYSELRVHFIFHLSVYKYFFKTCNLN
jgi:hypothetical protein